MLRHIVLLRFDDTTTSAHLDDLVQALSELPGKVPSIRRYEVVRDAGLADDNAQVAVLAEFDDRDGFLAYRDHPDHVKVITDHIRPRLAGRTALQHEL